MSLSSQKAAFEAELLAIFERPEEDPPTRTAATGTTELADAIDNFVSAIIDSDVNAQAQTVGLASVSSGTVRSQVTEILVVLNTLLSAP